MRLALAFLLLLPASLNSQSSIVNGRSHQGEELTVDLPGPEHMRNIGSYRDGLGMCVMSSIEMAARWAGLEEYRGLRDWCAREGGGAFPEKVDRQLAAYAKAKGLPAPRYVQYQGPNPEPILELCRRTGRLACVTYGRSPRYRGTISHMVCCPHFGPRFAAILDNNFPCETSYEWMSPAEAIARMKYPGRNAWVFVWLAPTPMQDSRKASPPGAEARRGGSRVEPPLLQRTATGRPLIRPANRSSSSEGLVEAGDDNF